MNEFSAKPSLAKSLSTLRFSTDRSLNWQSNSKRASHWGALFAVWLIVMIAGTVAFSVQARECPADQIDETVTVEQVVDGDTLQLKDGRLLRFIGINTTELGHDGKPAEPLAEQAMQTLKSMLDNSIVEGRPTVGLRYGAERKDRHGRTLAHVYLNDGRSVEAQLLMAGMAAHIVVPPNIWNQECYQLAEREARQVDKGVWSEYYRPIMVEDLSRDARGFHVISGRVMRVGESKSSFWLNFPRLSGEGRHEGVAIRISRDDLKYFKTWHPGKLKNKKIIVRGWLYQYKKQLVMRLRHPASLEIVSDSWQEKRKP